MIKNKNFKQEIGIAEKSQETRRDHLGGNLNHKSPVISHAKILNHKFLFWPSDYPNTAGWYFNVDYFLVAKPLYACVFAFFTNSAICTAKACFCTVVESRRKSVRLQSEV